MAMPWLTRVAPRRAGSRRRSAAGARGGGHGHRAHRALAARTGARGDVPVAARGGRRARPRHRVRGALPRRTLLVALAHPDDETFGTGGLMARAVDEGHRVVVVCATRGEVGEIAD